MLYVKFLWETIVMELVFCIIKIDGNLKNFLFTNNHILNEENIKEQKNKYNY